jgi:hypothetical protein
MSRVDVKQLEQMVVEFNFASKALLSQRMVPFALCPHKPPLYYFRVRKN